MTNAPTNNGLTGIDHFDGLGGLTLGRACEFPEEFPAEDAEFAEFAEFAEEGGTNLEPPRLHRQWSRIFF